MRLSYEGKALQDDQTLASYGIKGGTIEVISVVYAASHHPHETQEYLC